jgi:hypothetical protein
VFLLRQKELELLKNELLISFYQMSLSIKDKSYAIVRLREEVNKGITDFIANLGDQEMK